MMILIGLAWATTVTSTGVQMALINDDEIAVTWISLRDSSVVFLRPMELMSLARTGALGPRALHRNKIR